MKKYLLLILLAIVLSACGDGNMGELGCSYSGEVCIAMVIDDPHSFKEPTEVTINVTSTVNIIDLQFFLGASPPVILFEDSQNWDYKTISWAIDIEANKPQSFVRRFILPEKDGYFQLITSAKTITQRADISLTIHQENGITDVFYANTPIPYTPGPLPTIGPEFLQTLQAIPRPTRYPTLVPRPTNSSTPTSPFYPPPARPPWDAPGKTPYP